MHSSKLFITSSLLSVVVFAAPQIAPSIIDYFCPEVEEGPKEVAGEPWQIGLSVPGGDRT